MSNYAHEAAEADANPMRLRGRALAIEKGYDPADDDRWPCTDCGRDITAGNCCNRCAAKATDQAAGAA